MKFQIGDRISVSGPGWCVFEKKFREPVEEKWYGTIKRFDHNMTVVQADGDADNYNLWVYSGQCRKLVKKIRNQSKFYSTRVDQDDESGFPIDIPTWVGILLWPFLLLLTFCALIFK